MCCGRDSQQGPCWGREGLVLHSLEVVVLNVPEHNVSQVQIGSPRAGYVSHCCHRVSPPIIPARGHLFLGRYYPSPSYVHYCHHLALVLRKYAPAFCRCSKDSERCILLTVCRAGDPRIPGPDRLVPGLLSFLRVGVSGVKVVFHGRPCRCGSRGGPIMVPKCHCL